MRAFIAIDLPPEVRVGLDRWQKTFQKLSSGARWTRPEGIHLTLKFLGEIRDKQIEEVRHALAAIGPFSPFRVEIKGFRFFPDSRRPRVFWAGIAAPPDLAQIARRVEDALESIGFPREARAFSPHLTLARFRDPRPEANLREEAEKHAGLTIGSFDVKEFFLFESRLHPQGAEYKIVERFSG
jgi:RNA 2',3'-cyclic 3'-phosphodiesterase